MEKKTIELDGKLYEIKLVEPETTANKLPTLMEVFNKVKPTFYINESNKIIDEGGLCDDEVSFHNQLKTQTQCKRIQTIIAMQNIADYYNGEVDYRGKGCHVYFNRIGDLVITVCHENYHSIPKFKKSEHAQLAIEILRNENLLDNLK